MAIIKKFRIKRFKKSNPLVSFNKISFSYGKRQILDDVSFKLNSGEIVGLLGPNGVGKSTIFNHLTGLIRPDYGKVLFESTDATNYPIYLRNRKFKIGYVPQYGGFFQDLTLLENLKAIAEILIKEYLINNQTLRFSLFRYRPDEDQNKSVPNGGKFEVVNDYSINTWKNMAISFIKKYNSVKQNAEVKEMSYNTNSLQAYMEFLEAVTIK